MSNSLTDAMAKVVDLLSPLSSEERLRVVNASLTLLGEGVASGPATVAGAQGAGPADPDDDNFAGIATQAHPWLKKNNVRKDDLEHWYHFDQGKVTTLAIPGNASKRMQQVVHVYLIQGLAAYLATGEAAFSDGEARELCQHFGCYDPTNHSKALKAFGNRVTGSKSAGWKLTAPGMTAAAALIKGSSLS